ncbi:hypothetical protein Nepgr_029973 [Nepenthes gracilis]|uniref:Pentatricopeptide repeat-containing protein n=1 Tax=Nepenthes gracilis TaxID=150966 RepID=A0AAD3TDQ0_NEPGR|nr:hypothetical protein Nepgr_029973 [Nepenthes gracilis]
MEYPKLIFAQLGTPLSSQVILWNAMIRGYAYNGPFAMCVEMFDQMPQIGLKPNNFTYPYVLNCCCHLRCYRTGKKLHCHIVKSGFQSAFRVSESLLNMYMSMSGSFDSTAGEKENLGYAQKVFDEMCIRPVESWNRLISGYFRVGDVECARKAFEEMPERDVVSWNSMISGYAKFGDYEKARVLFEQMPGKNVVSWTSMIGAYANCGDLKRAREIFDNMPQRNAVSWNSMISCYLQNAKFESALQLFAQMQSEGVYADRFTFVSALSACSHLGALEYGKWITSLMRDWSQLGVIVATALLEMYAKCGDVDKAFTIFAKIGDKDVFCWNTMIKSLAIHGRTEDALKLFFLMQSEGLQPNELTFLSALFACSHGGLVEEGQEIFDGMEKDFGVCPNVRHFSCLIDLLSRNGQLERAVSLIMEMPFKPDIAAWGALLGGCRVMGDFKLAAQVIENANALNTKESGLLVSLSNMYASTGQWPEALSTREQMESKKIWKKTGQSCVV